MWHSLFAFEKIIDNCLHGFSAIINLLMEVINGNMNHDQCLKCYEENETILKGEKNEEKESALNLAS